MTWRLAGAKSAYGRRCPVWQQDTLHFRLLSFEGLPLLSEPVRVVLGETARGQRETNQSISADVEGSFGKVKGPTSHFEIRGNICLSRMATCGSISAISHMEPSATSCRRP